MKNIFIVAAPVGAVPQRVDPTSPRFLSGENLDRLQVGYGEIDLKEVLRNHGWEDTNAGGIMLDFDANRLVSYVIDAPLFQKLPSELVRRIIIILTSQGWRASQTGGLFWPHRGGLSYLPAQIAASINSTELEDRLRESGWVDAEAGMWMVGRTYSTDLPIESDQIVRECISCFEEGAAVVHLHTRRVDEVLSLSIKKNGVSLKLSKQENYIDVCQYEKIIPSILEVRETAIINISTSVRGSKYDFVSPIRRESLKPYGRQGVIPHIASFSPGSVTFSSGGGYENPDGFLAAQLAHFAKYGIRPEVEVFNMSILRNALGAYRHAIECCGSPVLFMLVACVDQTTVDSDGKTFDDSLVPPNIREEITKKLSLNDPDARQYAVSCLARELQPTIQDIRAKFRNSLISLLLPGILQTVIVEVALTLDIDGIRVGLEDSLTISDAHVAGGLRRAVGTYEQVRYVAKELRKRGVEIMSGEELTDLLQVRTISSLGSEPLSNKYPTPPRQFL